MGQGREAKHGHRAHPGDQAHPGHKVSTGPWARLHLHPKRGEFEGVLGLLAGLTMSFGRGRSARLAAELAGVGPGDRVVDVGCGPGRFLREAAERGAEAVGVEPSGQMRRVAGWRTPGALSGRVRVVDGTAERIPLGDGSATVVWAVASFHHWTDPEAGLAEVHRVLQPGGRVLIAERLARPGGWFRHHALTWEQGQDLVAQVERAGFSGVTAARHPLGRGQVLAVQARRPANPGPG
ncbi:MAG TPA: class I SAM-dependent methyltransferase [Actinomycetota bacterium]|nr:class I SAM-dependent methyltransferase [Actinomycetota bacterium]